MHLFIELLTLVGFLLLAAHAVRRHGRAGWVFFAALLFLGFVRETFVALYRILYEFADLSLMVGPAPLIAAVVWGFSIYLAVCWAEAVFGRSVFDVAPLGAPWWLGVAGFMMALAVFYEPFLARIEMARWQPGTRSTLGVPWIALVGYPTLTLGFLGLWRWARTAAVAPFLAGLVGLALAHAWGLQLLKDGLSW